MRFKVNANSLDKDNLDKSARNLIKQSRLLILLNLKIHKTEAKVKSKLGKKTQ